MDPILKINYDALEYWKWVKADHENLSDLCNQIFRGGFDKTSSEFQDILKAAYKAIAEVKDDMTNLENFLNAYK